MNPRSSAAEAQKTVYQSDVLAAVHEMASDLFAVGGMKPTTMKEFDKLCLTPVEEFTAQDIRAIRDGEGVSQAVLAGVINVTTSTVGQWERGERKPAGPSLKLLALAKHKGLKSIL